MLKNIEYIVKRLESFKYENSSIKGNIYTLSQVDIDNISPIFSHVEECSTLEGVNISDVDDYRFNIGNNIKIQVSTGNISGYYDSFSSFINKNKIKLNSDDFYIRDINFLSTRDKGSNEQVNNYFNNIKFIDFLTDIADYKKESAGNLELFFYKTKRGLTLKINYNKSDISSLSISNLAELKSHFFEKPDKEERKQIFINSLIDLLEKDGSYSFLIKEFDSLISKYEASFRLYLDGFSFEKIKTSSTEYFQKLTDRAYSQINKATTNIFIVPVAYIFLLKSFLLSGEVFLNIPLLIAAFIFSFLMHNIIFNNMSEGLDAIKADIDRFKNRVNRSVLNNLSQDLKGIDGEIAKQHNKVKILKCTNWMLFLVLLCSYVQNLPLFNFA